MTDNDDDTGQSVSIIWAMGQNTTEHTDTEQSVSIIWAWVKTPQNTQTQNKV